MYFFEYVFSSWRARLASSILRWRVRCGVSSTVSHVLLGDGRAALGHPAGCVLALAARSDAPGVDAVVVPEPLVLDGHHRVLQDRRDLVER